MTIARDTLVQFCNDLLNISAFRDYCPNGLQVEGSKEIKHIVTGVTACEALIDQAIALKADAILVHHGYFWKGESEPIVGMKAKRIRKLMHHDISLLAYHLPLDAHPVLGNNAQLGQRLGLTVEGGLDDSPNPIGFVGRSSETVSLDELASTVSQALGREPLVVGTLMAKVDLIGWCTGGAQSYITAAAEKGCSVYITGEVSEKTVHESRELGVAFIAAGHHATERYGAKALGEHIENEYGVKVTFVDIDNPA